MAYFHTTVLDNQIKALPTVDTASGAIATFNTDLTENLVSVKCQIVAKQASGTPSPDNPLPITTYTEMNVWRGNNNLLPNTATTQTINDVTFTVNADKSITVNGLASADTNFVVNQTTEIKKSGNYILKGCPQYGSSTTYYMRSTRGLVVSDTGSGSYPTAYNVGDAVYLFIHIHGGYNADNLVFKPMIIHENETDTEYHAYQGTTANIQFGQTVANGVLDITTGKLEITHGVYNLTGSCLEANWYNADIDRNSIGFYIYPTPYVNNTGYPFPIEGGGVFDYCQTGNVYNNDNAWTANFLFVSGEPNRFEIRLPKSVLSDISSGINALNSARDYLNNNPLQTMYKITPYSIQLDSITLQALLNENNIWCDTGDTEVKFLLTVGKKIS